MDRLVLGMAAGAAVAYLLDPDRGTRRQKRLRDRMTHGGHVASEFVGRAARDTANRARGIAARTAGRVRSDEADDVVISERIRAELGRTCSHPGAIDVNVDQGLTTLTGYVFSDEHDAVIAAVSGVRGVTAIEDLLDVREDAGDIPALQGAGRPRESRFELVQENWSPSVRLLVGTGAAALALYSFRRHDTLGALCALGGGALLARAITNEQLGRVAGVTGGRRAVSSQWVVSHEDSLPFGDELFDCVLCRFLLNFTENPVVTVREVYRLLRPNGTLIVSCFTPSANLAAVYRAYLDETRQDGLSGAHRDLLLDLGRLCESIRSHRLHSFTNESLTALFAQITSQPVRTFPSLGGHIVIATVKKPDSAR